MKITNINDVLALHYVKTSTGTTEIISGIDENGNILVGTEKIPFTISEFCNNFTKVDGEHFSTESLDDVFYEMKMDTFKEVLNFREKVVNILMDKYSDRAYIYTKSTEENLKDYDEFCKELIEVINKSIELGRNYERVSPNDNFHFDR